MQATELSQFSDRNLLPLLQDSYKALSDPTRRHLLEQLWSAPKSVNELASGLAISRPAVSQHLRVLLEAEMVFAKSSGTKRIYTLNKNGFRHMQGWVNLLCGNMQLPMAF